MFLVPLSIMGKKPKKYISIDIESSGPTPGKYSMLSIGACIVGDTEKQFYRELKPLDFNHSPGAMKVASLGLRCIDDLRNLGEYNPESEDFNSRRVLRALQRKGKDVSDVMADFAEWIEENTIGFKAVEAAAPIKFDGMFTAWYFDNFYSERNPLGYSGEDMNSVYRGVMKDPDALLKDLMEEGEEIPHNALEDAIIQAKLFEKVLELMKND